MTYRLHFTHRSPFARRIWIALDRLALDFERVEATPFEPTPEFLRANPLGLVPVLEKMEGGTAQLSLPDSNTVLEFLHEAHGRAIWPANLGESAQVRQASTWVTGLLTSAVSFVLETTRRSVASQEWVDDYQETVERVLLRVSEQDLSGLPWVSQDGLTQAGWDLGVALEYLDLRMPHIDWRKRDSRFLDLLGKCQARPVFLASRPPKVS